MNWVAHDIRDQVVDFVRHWSDRAALPARRLLGWIELSPRQYHRWQERFGQVNEHNGLVPRDHWLEAWEKAAIVHFAREYPLEGYRRLTFMMLDRDVVAVSPASVYRVLREADSFEAGPNPRAKALVLSSRWPRTSIGTLTFPTSTWPGPSTIFAASWMDAAVPSSIGKSGRQ